MKEQTRKLSNEKPAIDSLVIPKEYSTYLSFNVVDCKASDGFLRMKFELLLRNNFPDCFAHLAADQIFLDFRSVLVDFIHSYLPECSFSIQTPIGDCDCTSSSTYRLIRRFQVDPDADLNDEQINALFEAELKSILNKSDLKDFIECIRSESPSPEEVSSDD